MDDQPPRRTIPSRSSRVTHAFHPVSPPTPLQTSSRLIGITAGALAAGIWLLIVAAWYLPTGWLFAILTVLGALLVGFGLLLACASLADLLPHLRRRR